MTGEDTPAARGASVLHTPAGLADLVALRAAAAAPTPGEVVPDPQGRAVVWFRVTGLVLLASGALARREVRETGRRA